MAIKPLPTDQSAYVGTDGKPAIVFYTWLKSLFETVSGLLALFPGGTSTTAWTSFTPTIASTAGSITAYTATGRFTQIGKIVFFWCNIQITNNGTGGGLITVTLPAAFPTAFSSENAITGVEMGDDQTILGELFNDGTMDVRNYDSTYPGFTGADLVFSGTYEAA